MRSRVLILLTCLILAAFAAGHGHADPASLFREQPSRVPFLSFAPQSVAPTQGTSELPLKLPLKPKSVRFAVIGDNGTGRSPEFEVAQQMETYRQIVNFSFVIMLGDNIYGGHSPKDYAQEI